MGLSRVRAVFFDLDNTLIDTAEASRRGMMEVTSPRRRPPRSASRPQVPRCSPLELLFLPARAGRGAGLCTATTAESPPPAATRARTARDDTTRPPLAAVPRGRACGGLRGKRLRQGFGPGSYITQRGGPGLNLQQSHFPARFSLAGRTLVLRPLGRKMLSGHSFSAALLIRILLAVAADAVGHLLCLLQTLTLPYFPSSAFSFNEKVKEYQMWKTHL